MYLRHPLLFVTPSSLLDLFTYAPFFHAAPGLLLFPGKYFLQAVSILSHRETQCSLINRRLETLSSSRMELFVRFICLRSTQQFPLVCIYYEVFTSFQIRRCAFSLYLDSQCLATYKRLRKQVFIRWIFILLEIGLCLQIWGGLLEATLPSLCF